MEENEEPSSLETLLTKGPWAVARLEEEKIERQLTTQEVADLYKAIPASNGYCADLLGVDNLSDKKANKAFQLLKSAGLIEYDKGEKAWKKT